MRCLTIAGELRGKGHNVMFAMRDLPGHLAQVVENAGFQTYLLSAEEDGKHLLEDGSYNLCMIDHYIIDYKWEETIRPLVKKIVVIDDLANRMHDCDMLIDQNVVPDFKTRYDALVPAHCEKLLGPSYLIMRKEFIKERINLRSRTGKMHRLLVFMGGTDPTGETMKVLNALSQGRTSFEHVDVVVGSGNLDKKTIQRICEEEGVFYHCQIDYLAALMVLADFSIGAGGSTTWERCYVGLPSSSTIVAENQLESTEMAASLGAIWNLGWHEQVTEQTYERLLISLKDRQDELKKMSISGFELTNNPSGPNLWIDRILSMG
ncbi:pseudaminic acid biosynthesis protein PseG [Jeotgalibacillus soli]|uniref:Pseudaminic acid biosynthesis protein PseG n=2 Tax=Jeotgalibacillus soli TaxID=889306 RepID=A0A0C2VZZ3_9BACL|nr:pseudaminic acid biosynthesis protein PseG [Jeotgalibacillus soli]